MSDHIQDVKAECGCYELGDQLYDRAGNPTHLPTEECNQ